MSTYRRIFVAFAVLAFVGAAAAAMAASCCSDYCVINMSSKIWLNNNVWGKSGAASGYSSCISNSSSSAWKYTYNWKNGSSSGVKAFGSSVLGWHWGWRLSGTGLAYQLSSGKTVNTAGSASSGTNGCGNIAFDCWLHTISNPTWANNPSDELMIWQYKWGGAGPIDWGTYGTYNNLSINGATYKLTTGDIGWKVWSFVRSSNSTTCSLSIKNFTSWLVNNGKVPNSKYLTSVQHGSEVFNGANTLSVSGYSANVS